MNNPNRRQFLQLVGAGVVGVVVPLPTIASKASEYLTTATQARALGQTALLANRNTPEYLLPGGITFRRVPVCRATAEELELFRACKWNPPSRHTHLPTLTPSERLCVITRPRTFGH